MVFRGHPGDMLTSFGGEVVQDSCSQLCVMKSLHVKVEIRKKDAPSTVALLQNPLASTKPRQRDTKKC